MSISISALSGISKSMKAAAVGAGAIGGGGSGGGMEGIGRDCGGGAAVIALGRGGITGGIIFLALKPLISLRMLVAEGTGPLL